MSPHPSRRDLLKSAALTAATLSALPSALNAQDPPADVALGKEEADSPTPSKSNRPQLRVLFREPDHSPLDSVRMKQLHVRDRHNDPLPQAIVTAEGRARIELAAEPLEIVTRLNVPNFGEINCYADNDGRGYTQPGTVDFLFEAVRTRQRRVQAAIDQWSKQGVPVTDEIRRHMADGDRALPAEGPHRTKMGYQSLAHFLHAGEKLAVERARHRITKLKEPRSKDFFFGGTMWRPGEHPQRDEAFLKLFNFATVSWYSWSQPQPPYVDYAREDQSLNWCLAHNVTPKGWGYTYMARGATAEWIRPSEDQLKNATGPVFNKDWPYEKILAVYKHVNEQSMRRYAGRLKYAEIANEAHDKANLWRLNHAQILEMTVESLKAARRGSPTVNRMINNCCLWAEYAKDRNRDASRRWSPYTFMKDVLAHGGEFETCGLQLYYPRFDLFEIDRMLDRFADFNKPCHITEIACNSADGLDPNSMRPKDLVPGWHGPWTESTQADWAESVYTLVYSKPHFECIGWWDLADTPGHFWPNGALLRPDFTPKESYHRLAKLQKAWGWAKA
jgi:GH35 family endo-1,4-beta-xylanase